MESETAQTLIRAVGVVAIGCAAYGLYYNSTTFHATFRRPPEPDEPVYFRQAFYTLSAICIVFYVLLGWVGVAFVIGRSGLWSLFVALMVAEVTFFIAVTALWRYSPHAMSIAAASGVSSGGLMAQFIILFPLWAPIIVWFAQQRLRMP